MYSDRTRSANDNSAWVENGGIVGRGVLLDYCSWAKRNSVTTKPFETLGVPLSHIQSVIRDHQISFRPGDILCLRLGFTEAFNALSASEQKALAERPSANFMGLEPCKEILQWLWESQFAAVAADCPSLESSPVESPGKDPGVMLHQWLLAGWGMPIGEMFDFEKLAEHCEQQKRTTFFLSSVPLKVYLCCHKS